jgi:hypothetical protein
MKTDKNNLKQQKKQCLLVENHKESAFCNYKWEKKTQFIIKEEKKSPSGYYYNKFIHSTPLQRNI